MPVSKAQIKATTKYEAAKYDKILVRMPKGQRAEVQAAADAAGESLNGYIVSAVKQRMEKESGGEGK
ncbi:Arc family DNA-binding protein [uncultured Subdoligranulum sp.]|mgnify:CR=1 FL=1|uniref:Arc family DNA-binding protein n=1 Tax=uncultured Subdoligranulum sp. TaxID=512298 RepID=UPI00261DC4C7|nr:Arc family DNA-binding protein [uncultured Subdoligranulum sp.]